MKLREGSSTALASSKYRTLTQRVDGVDSGVTVEVFGSPQPAHILRNRGDHKYQLETSEVRSTKLQRYEELQSYRVC